MPDVNYSDCQLSKLVPDVCFDRFDTFGKLKKDFLFEKLKGYKGFFCLDSSINIAFKKTYTNQIDSFIKKLNYKKAIEVYEEMFENISTTTTSDINSYKKIIKAFNKLNPNKSKTDKEIFIKKGEYFKSAKGKYKIIDELEVQRKESPPKYKGLSYLDLVKNTNYISDFSPFISITLDKLLPKKLEIVPSTELEIYRITKDSVGDFFLIRTKNAQIYLLDKELKIINSFDASKIFVAHNPWGKTIDLSFKLNFIILSEGEEVYVYNTYFTKKFKWILPQNETEGKIIDKGNALSPEIIKYLRVLNLADIPNNNDEVKSAYKSQALKHHPDRNPDNVSASESKMKEINEAITYLEKIDFENISEVEKCSQISDPRIIFSFGSSGIDSLTPYQPNVVCGSHIDEENKLIYLACKSGNIYNLTLDGTLIKTFDFRTNNKYYYSFDSVKRIKDTLLVYDGIFVHIFKDDKYLKSIQKIDYSFNATSKLKFSNDGFILYSYQYIALYNLNGELIDILVFTKRIKSFFIDQERLIVDFGSMHCMLKATG